MVSYLEITCNLPGKYLEITWKLPGNAQSYQEKGHGYQDVQVTLALIFRDYSIFGISCF